MALTGFICSILREPVPSTWGMGVPDVFHDVLIRPKNLTNLDGNKMDFWVKELKEGEIEMKKLRERESRLRQLCLEHQPLKVAAHDDEIWLGEAAPISVFKLQPGTSDEVPLAPRKFTLNKPFIPQSRPLLSRELSPVPPRIARVPHGPESIYFPYGVHAPPASPARSQLPLPAETEPEFPAPAFRVPRLSLMEDTTNLSQLHHTLPRGPRQRRAHRTGKGKVVFAGWRCKTQKSI